MGMFGKFTESTNKMRVFSKVKENRCLQWRLLGFSMDMVILTQIILDDSAFEGKNSPFKKRECWPKIIVKSRHQHRNKLNCPLQ